MKSVAGKNVLVTGAAQGLGKLFATRAVEENAAAVVLWDVNEAKLKETAVELEAAGGTVHTYVVDVSAAQQVQDAAASVRADVGDVHVLINNAGIVRGNGYFWDNAVSDIEATMTINALAPMYITREFLPAMIASEQECRVVTIASSAGLTSVPRLAAYCGSKWAATGWSDSVRLELEKAGHKHVRVTTVCPTYINTGMFDGAQGILFTPMLEQDDVVADTWREMLKGGPQLILPWTSRLSKAVTGVLPVKIRDIWLDRTGVYDSMAKFTGHGK
ncbi:Short-chain dehydrogenase [Jatrophihabitans endophyticus]|uniref:Short-chain dehydrogenase n=1 Tax=Jatrophihabitans endophyticus TaxID=1206085 RepID=A0A1M5H7S3_9ACTN|nr:SDR family oxidoreductase [Jatrophihabitans endophyticus]SHG11933.1 Short-chain dehydrogenase [Jatrophihabitans endophyticus]